MFPGEPRRPLWELEKEVSLGLHHGHPLIMDGLRPVMPNFQFVGMLSCRPPRPLPQELEDFMAAGKERGVVYLSFGSVFKPSDMSNSTRAMLLKALGRLGRRVLVRWDAEAPQGLPNRIKLARWLPQQDILGHSSTRLFITHGGPNSFQECLCHQKPAVRI